MTRKPLPQPPLPTKRLDELAEIIADDQYALGPQDVSDLVEALRELVDRRRAEQIIQSLTVDDERSAA